MGFAVDRCVYPAGQRVTNSGGELMSQLPYSCIIGAGSSGVTTAKALLERGLPFDCFDRSDDIGGNWYFNNPNQVSSAYRMLHIDSSKSRMQYSRLSDAGQLSELRPPHAGAGLLSRLCRSFRHPRARSPSTPASIVPQRRSDGMWRVRLSTGEERRYDALFVCNGHHWNPRWPEPAVSRHPRRHRDPFALLSRCRGISRQERAGPRHGQ